uniref:DUF1736 domain-containing protein n=1 Tax=Electrophorus electricus TaxID=8005 RepID=A0A4W4HJF4_ELEEL
CVCVCVCWKSLHCVCMHVRAIKTNQDLLPETPWMNILYNDFWGTLLTHSGSHKSFRPLCTLSFRFNYALGGLEPWGYHLLNVGLHCCVTSLFTTLCRPLFGTGPWSLLAGLLFASHPVHTEAVAGLVGRADVGAGLCFLLSLLCYTRHCRLRPGAGRSHRAKWRAWAWLAGSLVAAAAAMLWKEQGVTVLAVSAVYDVCVVHRMRLQQVLLLFFKVSGKLPFSMRLLVSLAWLAGWGMVLLAARLYWMGNKPPNFSNSDNPAADSSHFLTRTLTFLYLPAVNAWLLLCPHTLSFDWSMEAIPLLRTVCDQRNFCSNTQNGYSRHVPTSTHASLPSKENMVVFSLGLLALPFLPATNMFFYVGFVVAERVLYIPSMGFCLLVVLGLRTLCVRARQRSSRTLLLGCTAGLLLLYSLRTVHRNQDWQNEDSLYRSGITVNPAKGMTELWF